MIEEYLARIDWTFNWNLIITSLIIMAIAYLVGSINTAIIVGKMKSNIDIREHGSGNAGLTNATRTMGKKAGVFVLLGDVAKAVIVLTAVCIIFPDVPEYIYVAGVGVVLGHNFPLYFKFKGGKGVLVSIVAIAYASWIVALCALAVWIIIVAITRYVSVGSILGAISTLIFAVIFEAGNMEMFAYFLILAVLCVKMHGSNIARLVNKEENKIGKKKE